MNSDENNEKIPEKRNFFSLGAALLDIDAIEYIGVDEGYKEYKVLAVLKARNPTESGIELFVSKKQETALQYVKLAGQLINNPENNEFRQKLDAFLLEKARENDALKEAADAEQKKKNAEYEQRLKVDLEECRQRAAKAFPDDIIQQDDYIVRNSPYNRKTKIYQF